MIKIILQWIINIFSNVREKETEKDDKSRKDDSHSNDNHDGLIENYEIDFNQLKGIQQSTESIYMITNEPQLDYTCPPEYTIWMVI